MPFNEQEFISQAFAWGLFLLILQIAFLLLIRPLVLWYFKINEQIEIQSKMLSELRSIRNEFIQNKKNDQSEEMKMKAERW